MGLIDTHTHLESFARAGTLEATLTRARESGLDAMITVGTAPDDWTLYRQLAQQYPRFVSYTVGLHPCAVDARWPEAVGQIESFGDSTGPNPVALGEIGLDRFHLPKNVAEAEQIFGWQRGAFAAQLVMAKSLGCPVVIHSRGAFRECVEMIDASGVDWTKVVFHCFTEGQTEMYELARRGSSGSFTGILTYKNAEGIRAAAKSQGLTKLMIETDAPYLTPAPHRGKPNELAFLRHTAEFAAELFEVTYEQFAEVTTANARKFFGL